MTDPKPCPFCGEMPKIYPVDPEREGDAFGQVRCEYDGCPANPVVNDDIFVADTRGSDVYVERAIWQWNQRA